jgi:hypothetical protein
MPDEASETTIIRLAPTFDAFGMVIDFLSGTETFKNFELSSISGPVQRQLTSSCNLAAMNGGRMIGYIGWMYTTREQAEDWVADRAILKPVEKEDATAAALTVFASTDGAATRRLIRGARELEAGIQVYFKRGYDTTLKPARKSTVLNTSF